MAPPSWADGPFPLIPTSKTTKVDGDPTANWVADDMANTHNVIIRQMNSMYLQAPHVKLEADQLDLCQYAVFFQESLHHHHELEETRLFPDVEKITGEAGIMEQNVVQHHEFLPALETFGQYAQACLDKKKSFDASQFIGLMDTFAPKLSTHLEDEIKTLRGLGKYKDNVKEIKKAYMALAADAQQASKTTIFPLVCGARDTTYEGGCSWPGFPFFVPYMVDYVFAGKHRSVWRFNPSTMQGKPRPLLFLPSEE
ncbi:uncharacterized protein K444DRAFT_638277 [Hyaloscypha bicolor E]|uniref:Hemerythrin-like domain-containing protein n=1 Tax=Hyaloscypha bicolor E TaxID=1095630 RepID=A0A2J6SH25_9HELO|nr:uncharacterized protein K444DRAFT_638277 [Hyaloscypha bicolor E]PMD50073.1 hypothetical protein K444DRAFT_638277 [Hyaloscypha bicolor E]